MHAKRKNIKLKVSIFMAVSSLCVASNIAYGANKYNDKSSINIGEVVKHEEEKYLYNKNQSELLNNSKNYKIPISLASLGTAQKKAVGPAGGAAQLLALAPGVHVGNGYGSTGASKYNFSINGLKQGWRDTKGGYGQSVISVTFDGIPMNDPASGAWQSPEVNQLSIIKQVNVTYGPGNPYNRWMENIGGNVNFVPLQPEKKAKGTVGIGLGSDNFKNIHFSLYSGLHDGYSGVLAGGYTTSNSFISQPNNSSYYSGFNGELPSYAYAYYGKLDKIFKDGHISLGAYLAKGSAYKPLPIPLEPINGVTVNGLDSSGKPIPGELYSQKTSGYYKGLLQKLDTNSTYMIYSKLNLNLAKNTLLHSMVWYRHGDRFHIQQRVYQYDAKNSDEYNDPTDNEYGIKSYISYRNDINDLKFGGYFLHSRFRAKNSIFNVGTGGSIDDANDNYRDNYFNQNDSAIFLQDTLNLSQFTITPGVRYVNYDTNYTPYTAEEYPEAVITNPKGDQARLPAASRDLSNVEPSISFGWRPTKHIMLFTNYSTAYQTPAFGGPGGPFQEISPTTIKLEKGVYYQAGFKMHYHHFGLLNNFLLSANWFRINESNQFIPILTDIETAAYGTSIYQGANIEIKDKPVYWLSLYANTSFTKAQFSKYEVSGHNFDGLPVSYVPSVNATIGADSDFFTDGVLISPRFWISYTGSQSIFDGETNTPSRQKMSSFTTTNIGCNMVIPLHVAYTKKLNISLSLLNLFNSKYNTYQYISGGSYYFGKASRGYMIGYPGAPLTVYGSVSLDF